MENSTAEHQPVRITQAAAEILKEIKQGSGFSTTRPLFPEQTAEGSAPLKWSRRETLLRVATHQDVLITAQAFHIREHPPEAFWKAWLVAAMNAPSEFRSLSKLTVKKQITKLKLIISAASNLQRSLEDALFAPYPNLQEADYFREISRLRTDYGSVGVPSILDINVKITSLKSASEKRAVNQLAVRSFPIALQRLAATLDAECIRLKSLRDDEHQNKGKAPERRLIRQLDAVLDSHFGEPQRKRLRSGRLVETTVNATFGHSGSTYLDRGMISDIRKNQQRKCKQ